MRLLLVFISAGGDRGVEMTSAPRAPPSVLTGSSSRQSAPRSGERGDCDHGQGPCIDADDLDQPYLAAHRTALDNRGRINARTRVPIDLPDEAESRENTSPR